MAKFRQGDLVLQSNQKIIQGGVEVLNADGVSELSSLTFAFGATITQFDTDAAFTADSDSRVPTQKAIKEYVDGLVAGSVPPGTDESIARYDGINTIQDSGIFIDDSDNITGINDLNVSGVTTLSELDASDIEASGTLTVDGTCVFHSDVNFVNMSDDITSSIYANGDSLFIDVGHQNTGEQFTVRAWNGSSFENLIEATQGFRVALYFDGNVSLTSCTGGIRVYDPNGNNPQVRMHEQAGPELGRISVDGDSIYIDAGLDTSGGESVVLRAWDGSSYDNLLSGTQGGSVDFYYDGAVVGQTTANGISGAVWG